MNKKLVKLLSAIVLMFPVLLGFMGTVNAAEAEKVTVNVHKRVFESGEKPKDTVCNDLYNKANTKIELLNNQISIKDSIEDKSNKIINNPPKKDKKVVK